MKTMSRSAAILALAVTVVATACASSGSSSTRGNRNLITAEELRTEPSGTLYEAVQRLRPRWLQNRGITSARAMRPTPPQVYMDNAPMGSVGAMRGISVADVERVEFMNANDATTRFGTGHDGGAILVSTRSGVSGGP